MSDYYRFTLQEFLCLVDFGWFSENNGIAYLQLENGEEKIFEFYKFGPLFEAVLKHKCAKVHWYNK